MADGGILVPADVVPFIDEIVKHGGCIIRYEVPLLSGVHLVCPAAMKAASIEWLGTEGQDARKEG